MHCLNNILQEGWILVSIEVVLNAEDSLHCVNPVLEPGEDVAELVTHISEEEGTKDEHVEEDESHQTRVEADSDITETVVDEGEEWSAGDLVDSPGLNQDWIQRW